MRVIVSAGEKMLSHRFVVAGLCITLGSLALLRTCSAVNASVNTHDLVVGTRVWGDQLLQKVSVKKDYSWFRTVKDMRTFPGDGISKITQLRVLDQAKDGNGATAVIVTGGPDHSFVTIKFFSQKNNPIDCVVELYGKR